MKRRQGWLSALALAALLLAACGPQLATPTPKAAGTTPTVPVAQTPGAQTAVPTQIAATQVPTAVPVNPADLPVDPNDYHTIGQATAPVEFIEYSDFQ